MISFYLLKVGYLYLKFLKRNDLYTPLDVYNGDLTGYAANCPLCNGHLGCTGQNV